MTCFQGGNHELNPVPSSITRLVRGESGTMYYTYVLYNKSKQSLYVGYSEDLKRRIVEHKQGKVQTTKHWEQLKLVFYEAFIDKHDALRRESYFKSTKGKRTLKLMLKQFFAAIV